MEKYYLAKGGAAPAASPVRLLDDPSIIRLFSSPLGWRIMRELVTPSCPMDIAKKIGVHEQKVYYYITKFRAARLVKEAGREQRHGTVARFYVLKDTAFGLRVANQETPIPVRLPREVPSLEPFIHQGKLNARIIVGSPDPHGPYKARASDSCCAIDLALFLGSLTHGRDLPTYKLDVELREADMKGNLIIIGGPYVNMLTHKINDSLPIFFDMRGDVRIVSRLSGNDYREDDVGIVLVAPNPFDSDGKILLFAGRRFQGTRAAVLGFVQNPSILEGNKFSKNTIARILKGFDLDGDGSIDSAELLE